MVKENSYICVQAFMVNDLHLKGNELLIYAIIYGFSQDGESEFTGSLQYLADWTCSTKQGVMKALQSLCEKQLILKNVELKHGMRPNGPYDYYEDGFVQDFIFLSKNGKSYLYDFNSNCEYFGFINKFEKSLTN